MSHLALFQVFERRTTEVGVFFGGSKPMEVLLGRKWVYIRRAHKELLSRNITFINFSF